MTVAQNNNKGVTMKNTESLFRACLASYSGRYSIDRVLLIDGEAVATDGHIIVRGPVGICEAVDVDGPKLPIGSIPWERDKYADEPIDTPDLPDLLPCKKCGGKGTVPEKECTNCGGYGEVECDYGHTHECPECDATGRIEATRGETMECPKCEGDGVEFSSEAVDLGPMLIGPEYLRIIIEHGGKIYPHKKKPECRSAYLEFPNGVIGAVMPRVRG